MKTLREKIADILKDENSQDSKRFAVYCENLTKTTKNAGFKQRLQKTTAETFADSFLKVKNDGLVFDGKNITLQPTGISYNYVAYKNKMLNVYPDSKIELGVVYQGDDFEFSVTSGQVHYRHSLKNPFENKPDSEIIGVYCVIKNKRGEFLTTLNMNEIQKHRRIAKTDEIWKSWFKEMVLKTAIKKATKYHYEDIFAEINEKDNENYDLEKAQQALEIDEKEKQDTLKKMKGYKKIESLRTFYASLPKNVKLAVIPEFKEYSKKLV